jgi:hypothetical protein
MLIVDFSGEPTLAGEGEFAVMVKSAGVPNVKVAVAWCVNEPLPAVIVTL